MSANGFKSVQSTSKLRGAILMLAVSAMAQAAPFERVEAAPSLLAGKFSGGSNGVSVGLGLNASTLLSFNSAQEGCPCRGTNGVAQSSTMPSMTVLGAVSAGSNTASTLAKKTATTATTTDVATVTKLSLFDGLITADAITATASVGASATTLATSSGGTNLVNLVIAGQSINPDVPENTVVDLPGLGAVTVKAVTSTQTSQNASIEVDGLSVTIGVSNKFGLAVGSRIALANAVAGYSRVQPAAVLGGYSQTANLSGDGTGGGNIGSALGFSVCSDTNGQTETRTTEGLTIPGLATIGTATVTAFGGPVGSTNVAKTTSKISNVSLLGGLITAGNLTAVAQEIRPNTSAAASTPSTTGSGFTDLTIAGLPVPLTIPANTVVKLPGFGSATINEQVTTPAAGALRVTELDIVINQPNLLSIPVGTHLMLGTAYAVAQNF